MPIIFTKTQSGKKATFQVTLKLQTTDCLTAPDLINLEDVHKNLLVLQV